MLHGDIMDQLSHGRATRLFVYGLTTLVHLYGVNVALADDLGSPRRMK